MHVTRTRWATSLLACGAFAAGLATAATGSSAVPSETAAGSAAAAAPVVKLRLAPSSGKLADCMPKAKVNVRVKLTTDQVGFDDFHIRASGLPPKRDFTVFLLQKAEFPFGAAEYIGDFTTDKKGNARNTFKLIVEEAFSSTLVKDKRVRAELNQVGVWFADPAGDDFCFGKGKGGVTPFDGDDEAGVQAFNSRKAKPLP